MIRSLFFAALVAFLASHASAGVRVIDGDTLEIGGTIYRLNGIDAPEHGQTCGGWPCGAEATAALRAAISGKSVSCQAHSRDAYDRVIATCFVGGQDIGALLVSKGQAWAFLKYSNAYADQELAAKAKSLGIWSGDFVPPWEFRAQKWQSAEQVAPAGCPIKGNITKNGKIYHTPWSPWYSRTRINEAKGERWFCSEDQALAAGWRAPYWN